jgi:acyl carrier protein phosphodiesterase
MVSRDGFLLEQKVRYTVPGTQSEINRAMQGMAARATFRSSMARAIDDLQRDYEKFENDFRKFFPELAAHSISFLRQQKHTDRFQHRQGLT